MSARTGYLEGKSCYLGGPIQYGQPGWRDYPKNILFKYFGINVFDPFTDPKQQWLPEIKKAQDEKDYEKIAKIAKAFVRKDLGTIDRQDFTISYLPYKVPTAGTVHEIVVADNLKKPALLVTNQNDISYIPIWYYGFIPIEFMFPNWEKLFKYLKEVNEGFHKDKDEWSFVYGDG